MESMNIEIMMNEEQKNYRQKCIEACKKDELILQFLREHGCDLSFVENHSSKLLKWAQDQRTCAKCLGLDHCVFDNGRNLDLELQDGFLIQVYRKCRYFKKEEEKTQFLKNYILFHGNNEMKLREFDQADLKSSDALEIGRTIKELLTNMQESKGIYLCGKPGIGKTFLMNCLANQYVKDNKKVAFVNAATLIFDLKAGFYENGLIESTLNKLKKCDVLFLDDIGGESVTSWSRDEILMPLLNERMEKRMKTYFTSNYSFKELEEHFSFDSRGNEDKIKANRLMERIKAVSVEKKLKGVNRRG